MCVKTKRLDVAVKCLGQMGNIRACRSLRTYERNRDASFGTGGASGMNLENLIDRALRGLPTDIT